MLSFVDRLRDTTVFSVAFPSIILDTHDIQRMRCTTIMYTFFVNSHSYCKKNYTFLCTRQYSYLIATYYNIISRAIFWCYPYFGVCGPIVEK